MQQTTEVNGIHASNNGERTAAFVKEFVESRRKYKEDPAFSVPGAAPNFNNYVLPHLVTFQSLQGTYSKVYQASDEALRNSSANAKFMRNNIGIMECVEARQRMTALLPWHLEPEDERSHEQKELCERLTVILERIKRFTEYRRNLMEGIWFGRYGIQNRYGWQNVGGRMYVMPKPRAHDDPGWKPIHGDKLVFRYDDGASDHIPDQMGIRVSHRYAGTRVNNRWVVEPTGRGLAYFLTEYERSTVTVHKHFVEDGAYDDYEFAGTIHGVGIRSRIYWEWFQMQESLAFLMEYLERCAGGIEIWPYQAGNPNALENTKAAAGERISNQRNIVFVPIPGGEVDTSTYLPQVIEPGFSGADIVRDLIEKYYGHRIKRYILGQTLSSEADATGLGSGVADLHYDTLQQIVKYDSGNLGETLTYELVKNIQHWNFPSSKDIHIRFVLRPDAPEVAEKMEAYSAAWQLGARISESAVLDAIGESVPETDEVVLQNPQLQQAQQQAAMGGMFPGADFGTHDADNDGFVNDGTDEERPALPFEDSPPDTLSFGPESDGGDRVREYTAEFEEKHSRGDGGRFSSKNYETEDWAVRRIREIVEGGTPAAGQVSRKAKYARKPMPGQQGLFGGDAPGGATGGRSKARQKTLFGSGKFDESKHPRGAKGTKEGGRFVKGGGGGTPTEEKKPDVETKERSGHITDILGELAGGTKSWRELAEVVGSGNVDAALQELLDSGQIEMSDSRTPMNRLYWIPDDGGDDGDEPAAPEEPDYSQMRDRDLAKLAREGDEKAKEERAKRFDAQRGGEQAESAADAFEKTPPKEVRADRLDDYLDKLLADTSFPDDQVTDFGRSQAKMAIRQFESGLESLKGTGVSLMDLFEHAASRAEFLGEYLHEGLSDAFLKAAKGQPLDTRRQTYKGYAEKPAKVPRFKTANEAHKYARENFVKEGGEYDLSGLKVERLQSVIDGMSAVMSRFGVKIEKLGWNPKRARSLGQYMAVRYGDHAGTMFFQKTATKKNKTEDYNKAHERYMKSKQQRIAELERYLEGSPTPAGRADLLKTIEKTRGHTRHAFFMDDTDSLRSVAAHEAAHAVYYTGQAAGVEFERRWQYKIKPHMSEVAKISEYGATNASEAFAEITCAMTTGRESDVPKSLQDVWREAVEEWYPNRSQTHLADTQ